MSIRNAVRAGIAIVTLMAFSACGLTGDLKRPDPLWGEPRAETAPAELPESSVDALPELPGQSPEEVEDPLTPPDAEDELLGGPGGSL